MKKYLNLKTVCLFSILVVCALFSTGCFNGKVEASFLRMDIGRRTNDYYFDFSVTIDNKTSRTETICTNDFYIEINDRKIDTVSFLYAYQEVFYPLDVSIKSNESLTLRVRAISEIRDKEQNQILVKFKNKILINNNVTISDTKI